MEEVLEQMETQGLTEHKGFTMRNSVKAFNILSDSLYMNKVQAVIRELSCNAGDAHIEAGTSHLPFEIHMPDAMSPFFYIRDFGTGLEHDDVLNLYTTYFDSTKTNNADATGALGLGSKSPFSVVDDFTVVSYQSGIARTYFAFKNEQGFPCISFVGESDEPDSPNGIKIQFAVRKDKFNDFRINLPLAVYHFDPYPVLKNSSIILAKEQVAYSSDNWEIGKPSSPGFLGTSPIVVMAKINYPLDVHQLEHLLDESDHYLLSICSVPIRIYVENRSVDHTPSREHLQYNKKTISTIKQKLVEIYNEIVAKVTKEFAECETLRDIADRCMFLARLSARNQETEPWKSNIREFRANEFVVFLPVLTNNLQLGKSGSRYLQPTKIASTFAQCIAEGSSQHAITHSIKMDHAEFGNYAHKKVGDVWNRIVVKSFDQNCKKEIYTEEEIKLEFDRYDGTSYCKSDEIIKNDNLGNVRIDVKERKNHNTHVLKYAMRKILGLYKEEVLDDAGNVITPAERQYEIDPTQTLIDLRVSQHFVNSVFVIDDYPKDTAAIYRCGFARILTRHFTDYILFTNVTRSGGRFTGIDYEIFEKTIRQLGKESNIHVVKASELKLPEVLVKPDAKKAMDKSNYSALNILQYSSANKFEETPGEKMPEDFQIPDFNEADVIFVRRHYNTFYLFGDEDSVDQNYSREYRINDKNSHLELEELIRFFSIYAGRDILKGKTLVAIKTKSLYQKAKTKSKWVSLTDVITDVIKNLSTKQLNEIITIISLSQREGLKEFASHFGTSREIQEIVYNRTISTFDNRFTDYAKLSLSAISGAFCHLTINREDAFARIETVQQLLKKFKSTQNDKHPLSCFVNDLSSYWERNSKLMDSNAMFQIFSARGHGSSFSLNAMLNNPDNISQIMFYVLGKRYYVLINDFMLKCKSLTDKFSLLSMHSTVLTRDETQFIGNNVKRSKDTFDALVDYLK